MAVRDRAANVALMLGDWDRDRRALHRALAEAIAEALRLGRVDPHLPSERALAAALRVSRGTVAAAYDLLRERDVLERERGSGSYAVAHDPRETCEDPLACVATFFARPARSTDRPGPNGRSV